MKYSPVALSLFCSLSAMTSASNLPVGNFSSKANCGGDQITIKENKNIQISFEEGKAYYSYLGKLTVNQSNEFTTEGIENLERSFSKVKANGLIETDNKTGLKTLAYKHFEYIHYQAFAKTQTIPTNELFTTTLHPCENIEHVSFTKNPTSEKSLQGKWKIIGLKVFEMEDVSDKNYSFEFKPNGELVKKTYSELLDSHQEFKLRYQVSEGLLLISASDSEKSDMVAWPVLAKEDNKLTFPTMIITNK